MFFLLWLFCSCPVSFGQPDSEILARYLEEKLMLDYNYIDRVARRVPRQGRLLQRLETRPRMAEFMVKSTIISRYAFTAVSCTMVNSGSEAKEGVFEMQIPAAAFVSNFTMIAGDRTYHGEVTGKEKKHKEEGKEKDNKRSSPTDKGENGFEMFRASGTIPRKTQAVFLLHYEELLQRHLGKYEYTVSIRPQQLVGRLRVEVNILESSGIISLEVPPLRNSRQRGNGKVIEDSSPPPSTVVGQTKTLAKVTFTPNVVQQAKIARNGILGDFIIRYDVNRELSVGDVQILNGYFVHFFAPWDLPPLPKNVVFVLDSSASMVGTKLRQTKDALFTILQDLRPEDNFNIIGFSNRIKVWEQDRLVSVTPNNIRDAKKYIHKMSPSGGTDINGALQTGSKLLNDYIAQNDIDARSVSLIIFLTDGRPTVGETQSSKILSNTKEAIRNKFCLFTIGIGNDVDYKLLERMALENCGMMRRIQEDEDAAAQLKGFYDEVGTPLLSNIRVDYPKDSVEQVTQSFFPNYFNGSEIVVAGKVINHTSDRFHVEVTASNSNKYILLKTDVNIDVPSRNDIRGIPGLDNGKGDQNYIERAWSYLTIKELLTSWLKSDDSAEKERLMERAKSLALTYNFVTPFTRLKMKEFELQSEGPEQDYAHPPTEGTGERVQGLQGHKALPALSAPKQQEKQRIRISKTSADGDPHFVIDFPSSKLAVCFNIDGQPGDILRLVSDHKESGVTVNGQLIGAPAPPSGHKKQRTYFSTITILSNKPGRSYLEITPTKVILDDGERLILPCDQSTVVGSSGLEVSVAANSNVTVTIGGTISFIILIHQYKNPAPYQRDHLGFYISNSKGLSTRSHGLLGQFLYHEVKLVQDPPGRSAQLLGQNQTEEPKPGPGNMLKVKGRLVPVVQKQRKIYNGQQEVDCWFAKNNADKLIDGVYKDYLASHPFDTGTGVGMSRQP
ncbi:PREDICTED: inter-alpha-trypsin inhibitor heavy chain H5 [Crocodylus porosus]|uniref:inter-alpha-trypsin inhibitor heavy chain H5 n=1 Tax=Crocodylus porosus TaxID=8502 RepID=UPI00093AFA11|nr:PREDICTED: inter-alpha-trypsin inhibitor heavy chain H5 [Crocodylus porosus]